MPLRLEHGWSGREMGAWVWCSCPWIQFVPGGVRFYEKRAVVVLFLIPCGRASINDQSRYRTGVNGLLTFVFWHRALPPGFLDVSFCLMRGHIDWKEESGLCYRCYKRPGRLMLTYIWACCCRRLLPNNFSL